MDMYNKDVNPNVNYNDPGMQPDHYMVKRQEPHTVKGSGINLPHVVRMEMAKLLDEHNCALHVAMHQYNKHHWLTEGPESFLSLHHLLDEHVEKTIKHIDMIGERIARLGGIPTGHPVTQHELSYIKHEAEGRYTMRDMLRNDLEHEMKMQDMMRKQIDRAHQLKDFGTVEVLEEVLLTREDLAYHLYSVLEDDSLIRGLSRNVVLGHKMDQNRKADNEYRH
ncbi:ferritin-like domain-containing protein [Alkalicella caledoniensis]|uniref:Ferritin-like domain-containing protein n=1 Tax=Alkalicella caledoniensis TaxID=2731377 RepID=A0A7G9WC51_ALKCA|nr:ferritin-like domain-containing protein [Alkalicella caledoniensis]QNO16263.1 ferritin-like domain-containing protein [Alkalicella caledoniensis]